MTRTNTSSISLALMVLVVLAVNSASGCDGGSGAPTAPTTGTPPSGSADPPIATTVVTVSGNGVSPAVITIPVGARVTFTNADTRPHDFSGGPDPSRPECPEIDVAGFVGPGQSRQTGVFATARTCVYHDHAYLGVAAFTGRIVIQ